MPKRKAKRAHKSPTKKSVKSTRGAAGKSRSRWILASVIALFFLTLYTVKSAMQTPDINQVRSGERSASSTNSTRGGGAAQQIKKDNPKDKEKEVKQVIKKPATTTRAGEANHTYVNPFSDNGKVVGMPVAGSDPDCDNAFPKYKGLMYSSTVNDPTAMIIGTTNDSPGFVGSLINYATTGKKIKTIVCKADGIKIRIAADVNCQIRPGGNSTDFCSDNGSCGARGGSAISGTTCATATVSSTSVPTPTDGPCCKKN